MFHDSGFCKEALLLINRKLRQQLSMRFFEHNRRYESGMTNLRFVGFDIIHYEFEMENEEYN